METLRQDVTDCATEFNIYCTASQHTIFHPCITRNVVEGTETAVKEISRYPHRTSAENDILHAAFIQVP